MYPNQNNTLKCLGCETITGCYTCSQSERRCTKCQAPMGPDSNGNCTNCTDKQYWENGICNKNMEGCINQLNSNECIKCSDKYFLLNKICVLKSHSENCHNETTHSCEDCTSGIVIGGSCDNNVENCKYYSTQTIGFSSNKCYLCNNSYHVSEDNFKCEKNNDPIATLIYNDYTYQCMNNYYLSNEMECHECSENNLDSELCNYYNNTFHSYTCKPNTTITIENGFCSSDE